MIGKSAELKKCWKSCYKLRKKRKIPSGLKNSGKNR